MNTSAKTIAVFTSTGDQGSSVVKTLLKAGWAVTGFTRNTNSDKSKALAQLGAEMVKADLDDPESYKGGLKGKDAAFVNADFWATYLTNGYNAEAAVEREIQQSKTAIQAAVDAGVKQIIYSTLDGGLDNAHWDSKAAVSKWAKENNLPVTHLYLTFYFSGITRNALCKPNDDGTFTLGMPGPDKTKVPGVPVEQTGLWVKVALENPDKWTGKDIYGVTDSLSIAEMAATLSKISGKTVKTNNMPEEYFNSSDFKGKLGNELWNQWKMFVDGNPKRDISGSRALVDGPWDFEAWAKQSPEVKKILGF